MYGLGNWAEIAEHVGTKSKETCIEHYSSVYMQSQYFPLPVWYRKTPLFKLFLILVEEDKIEHFSSFQDMSLVVGKNRKELLAMAKGYSEDKKGLC